ncbi:MAG: HEPN domain-containing protein [Candidatus Omnitrophica bacterium]|nr:HEPN domain-containing protein [Candidatus Omnitrophota bacterium]
MTDMESLLSYRLKQAEETLLDAERMHKEGNFSPRSITNRAYYSMFYAVLALFLKTGIDIKTSKHIGVISIFDKELIKTGKIDMHYSAILHKMFNVRQKVDYKEFVEISNDDVGEHVKLAREFFDGIRGLIA